mmetsp:Transcript_5635/g.3246  ORF Transcript_5635/g.3246 Transcript_5635/m.3246 type:complete len:354 (-) Transcript_5635:308-1369(-)
MNIIKKTKNLKPHVKDSELGFGTMFTDHMINMDYNSEQGWHNIRIEPYSSIETDPATMVFHYGQAVFEGLKAFFTESGKIILFRPKENFKRLNRSCRALCIPEIDETTTSDALKELLKIEKDWIPKTQGTALYIRPTIIAMDTHLGVRASNTYRFFIILSPVGAYYSSGFNPIKILVEETHVRAVRGGLGCYKASGNYAASLYASEKAKRNGYAQVLWLDGVELKYIEEVGAMNIFFVIEDEIVTPELYGSILPGITRDSVIYLAKQWNMKISERKISIDELVNAYNSGKLKEAFGSGTAAVISSVGEIKYRDKIISIGDGKVGTITNKFYKALTDIQYGRTDAPNGWIEPVF